MRQVLSEVQKKSGGKRGKADMDALDAALKAKGKKK